MLKTPQMRKKNPKVPIPIPKPNRTSAKKEPIYSKTMHHFRKSPTSQPHIINIEAPKPSGKTPKIRGSRRKSVTS